MKRQTGKGAIERVVERKDREVLEGKRRER